MGSGSSKEKSLKSDHVTKSSLKIEAHKEVKQSVKNEHKKDVVNLNINSNDESQKKIVNGSSYQNNTSKKVIESKNNSSKTGLINNNGPKRDLGKFESDSESEGEDIADVLAATKRAHNNRVQEQNYYNSSNDQTSYPETYAQRLQREQYKQQPQGLIRQKTIYRNPDEWDIDENAMESFDVSKFKEANVGTLTTQNKDIFTEDIYTGNAGTSTNFAKTGPNPDLMYSQPVQKRETLPRYDTSEEALLDEIEKEYEI